MDVRILSRSKGLKSSRDGLMLAENRTGQHHRSQLHIDVPVSGVIADFGAEGGSSNSGGRIQVMPLRIFSSRGKQRPTEPIPAADLSR